ncbi:MAG: CCA tRNA nucleotidyltransferase [Rhodobacteraceae bacterium]|nr:CCA tRNA nucleotidyltransferase [Paracoccaceae bacterium]
MARIEADVISSETVRAVFKAFNDAGRNVLLVGGCVRDALLGKVATDIDMATDVLPDDVLAIADAAGITAVPLGIEHGTVRLVVSGKPVDITTFRSDIETDGRHATVSFRAQIREDAARRDFSINALYAQADGTVVDPLGALADLDEGRVRFIGDPGDRIREDYLRILRFFRFHAAYGHPDFPIDADAVGASAALSSGIDRLSRERITAELEKLLSIASPVSAVRAMEKAGVLERCLPGAGCTVFERLVAMERALELSPDWLSRLAALGGKLTRIRLSRTESRRIEAIRKLAKGNSTPAESAYRFGRENATGAALLRTARTGRRADPNLLREIARGSVARFPLRAADLQPALSGRALGDRLRELETCWIESGFILSRSQLLDR